MHCHTPMGGVVGRLAANAAHTAPVLYTAHGFHFYKGCPLKNRLIYQTAETFFGPLYRCPNHHQSGGLRCRTEISPAWQGVLCTGIGVDVKNISSVQVDRATKRAELGIPEDAFVFVSVGELNENKNHRTVIRAFAKTDMTNSYYLICGEGELKQEHLKLTEELGVSDRVRFLGFRTDVSEILRSCDCFVFPSFREGLSVSLMEAMAAGLPCIASRIRGNVDLLPDSRYLFESSDEAALCQLMCDVVDGVQVGQEYARNKKTLEQYDVRNVSEQMKKIYTELLGD